MHRLRAIAKFVSVAVSILLVMGRSAMNGRGHPAAPQPEPVLPAGPPAPTDTEPAPPPARREVFPSEVVVDGQTIELPRPSFRPMTVAFGVTFLMFGLVASRGFVLVGLLVLIWGILGWIREVRRADE
jgi:hypothetical protein